MKNKIKTGLTLVEISIGVVISALLLAGIMNLLSAGMKGSTKGLSHQANMESASILMSQIEYDLLRAKELSDPPINGKDSSARWIMYYSHSDNGDATVSYSVEQDSIVRIADLGGGKTEKQVFCKGHKVNLNFTRFAVQIGFEQIRHGMFVELSVGAKEDTKLASAEVFSMKRLVMIRSQL